MKKNSLRLLLAGLLGASALVAWAPMVRASELSEAPSGRHFAEADTGNDLEDCISQKRKLSVVFLVDESKSLVANSKRRENKGGNDPFGLRVLPMKAVVENFVSLNEDQTNKIEMTAAIFGFGASFVERQGWTTLDSNSLGGFSQKIEAQGNLNGDSYTRYHVALKGAVNAFDSDPNGTDSCRILYWFSDGEHDDDDDSGLSNTEVNQIKNQVCSANGFADQLRSKGVQLLALGLNKDSNQTELMKLIAENEGSFQSGNFNIKSGGCGVVPAIGKYIFALNTSELGRIIEGLPGVPDEPVQSKPCASGEIECREVKITADDSVTGFKVLVSQSGSNEGDLNAGKPMMVELILPDGKKINVFDESAPKANAIGIQKTSETGAILTLRKTTFGSLAGDWVVRFTGQGASEAQTKLSVEAIATIKLTDDQGNNVDTVDRFKPEPLKISVVDGKALVQKLKVFLDDVNGNEIVPSTSSATEFSINPKDLAILLQSPSLKSALGAKLTIELTGAILGLTGADNKPFPVTFKPVVSGFGITNGALYPSYVPGDELNELKIKDTAKATIQLKFRGPDAAEGVVKIVEIDQTSLDKEFVLGGDSECVIPAQAEVICEFTVAPKKNGYGSYTLPIKLTLNSDLANEAQEQDLPITVFLTRSPNVGKGVKNAILLIAAFILIQTLIRAISALSLSRFSALGGTARRVKVAIQVSSDGSVSGQDGGVFVAPESGSMENNFAIELLEKQNSFDLFGYSFHSSALRTFFRSTVRECLGYVSSGGQFVFGSAGTRVQRSSKMHDEPTEGQVDLSLRLQWVIGVPANELLALANGQQSASGELIAILDPYEMVSLEQQISNLQFSIASSQFGSDFIDALSRLQEGSEPTPVDGGSVDPFGTSVPTNGPFESSFDPFGTSVSSHDVVDEPTSKKESRRRRKDKSSDDGNAIDNSSAMTDPFSDPFNDPFA
jgi:hypothetical protein